MDIRIKLFVFIFSLFLLSNLAHPYARIAFFYYFEQEPNIFFPLLFSSLIFSLLSSLLTTHLLKITNQKNLIKYSLIYLIIHSIFFYFTTLSSTSSLFIYFDNVSYAYGAPIALLDILLFFLISSLSSFLILNLFSVIEAKSSVLGATGVLASLFSTGCITCGSLLWALLGISSLSFLPFQGLEFKFLSLLLILISIYLLLKDNFKNKKINKEFKL